MNSIMNALSYAFCGGLVLVLAFVLIFARPSTKRQTRSQHNQLNDCELEDLERRSHNSSQRSAAAWTNYGTGSVYYDYDGRLINYRTGKILAYDPNQDQKRRK